MAIKEQSNIRAGRGPTASQDWDAATIDATVDAQALADTADGNAARSTSPASLGATVALSDASIPPAASLEHSASWLAQALPGHMRGVDADDDLSALPAIPQHIYVKAGEIARGGMGRIIEARDRRLGRTVALKELISNSAGPFARFEREARITARLQHPSIVPVYEAGIWADGTPFYAMKLLMGESLDKVVARTTSFRERLALVPAITQVAEALAYAHSKHIVHRDLKPANVIIGEFGEIVVIDWGLAKDLRHDDVDGLSPDVDGVCAPDAFLQAEADDIAASDDSDDDSAEPDDDDDQTLRRDKRVHGGPARAAFHTEQGSVPSGEDAGASRGGLELTLAGSAMGTPSYMPPEQALGEHVDERADVYALGAMLYHVLSGKMAYADCETAEAVLVAVVSEPPKPLAELVPEAPADLVAIVDKAMARQPEDRYSSAKQLAEDLSRFNTGQLVSVHEYSTAALMSRFVARHRAVLTVAGSMLAVLAVLAVLGVLRIRSERNIAEEQRAEAQAQRQVAEAQKLRAETAQGRAEARSNALTLTNAASAMERDPTTTLTWLTEVAPTVEYAAQVRLLTEEARARGIARHVLRGHDGRVHGLAFSHSGRYLATSSTEGSARVWAVASGMLVADDRNHTRRLAVEWSPDDQWLALAGSGGEVLLWNPVDGRRQTLVGTGADVQYLAFSPDGARLAATCADTSVLVWHVDEPRPQKLGHTAEAFVRIAFSPDGSLLILGQDSKLAIIDASSGAPVATPEGVAAYSTAISPDGRWLAAADQDRGAYLWARDPAGAHSVQTFTNEHASAIAARILVFSPDSRYLAMSDGHLVRVIDTVEHGSITLAGHSEQVNALAFARDSRHLASGSRDQSVHVVDVATGQERMLRGHTGEITRLSFAPDGELLASASRDGTVRIWALSDGETVLPLERGIYSPLTARVGERHLLSGVGGRISLIEHRTGEQRFIDWHRAEVRVLAFARARGRLASLDTDGAIGLHEIGPLVAANQVGTPPGPSPGSPTPTPPTTSVWLAPGEVASSLGKAKRLAMTDDGEILAVAHERGPVLLYQLEQPGRPMRALSDAPEDVLQLGFSDDGQILGWVGAGGAGVWYRSDDRAYALADDAATNEVVQALAFSPDGRFLATGGTDRGVRLWDLASRTLEARFDGHVDYIVKLVFSRDGRRLASADKGGGIKIWDIDKRTLARSLDGHHAVVTHMVFSADARLLISASWDGTVRAWDVGSGLVRLWRHGQSAPPALESSRDGHYLFFGATDGVAVWPFGAPADPEPLSRFIRGLTSATPE